MIHMLVTAFSAVTSQIHPSGSEMRTSRHLLSKSAHLTSSRTLLSAVHLQRCRSCTKIELRARYWGRRSQSDPIARLTGLDTGVGSGLQVPDGGRCHCLANIETIAKKFIFPQNGIKCPFAPFQDSRVMAQTTRSFLFSQSSRVQTAWSSPV